MILAELEMENNLTIGDFTFPYAIDPMQFQPKSQQVICGY